MFGVSSCFFMKILICQSCASVSLMTLYRPHENTPQAEKEDISHNSIKHPQKPAEEVMSPDCTTNVVNPDE